MICTMARRRLKRAERVPNALFDSFVLYWVRRLTGLEPARVEEAANTLAAWAIPHLSCELLGKASIDAAVATTLVVEATDRLVESGVERTKLMAKLRGDRDV